MLTLLLLPIEGREGSGGRGGTGSRESHIVLTHTGVLGKDLGYELDELERHV